jgi:hypothetical protein
VTVRYVVDVDGALHGLVIAHEDRLCRSDPLPYTTGRGVAGREVCPLPLMLSRASQGPPARFRPSRSGPRANRQPRSRRARGRGRGADSRQMWPSCVMLTWLVVPPFRIGSIATTSLPHGTRSGGPPSNSTSVRTTSRTWPDSCSAALSCHHQNTAPIHDAIAAPHIVPYAPPAAAPTRPPAT